MRLKNWSVEETLGNAYCPAKGHSVVLYGFVNRNRQNPKPSSEISWSEVADLPLFAILVLAS